MIGAKVKYGRKKRISGRKEKKVEIKINIVTEIRTNKGTRGNR